MVLALVLKLTPQRGAIKQVPFQFASCWTSAMLLLLLGWCCCCCWWVVVASCCLLLLLGHFAVASTKHLSNANNSSIFSIAKCSQLVAVVVILVVVNAKREKIATTTAATATPVAATIKYNNNNNRNRKNINLAGIFLALLCPASGPTDLWCNLPDK